MKFFTKLSLLFTFSLFIILLMACQAEDIMKKVIGVTWIRSFEDDKEGTQAYRPETYDFPPARGREGWRFEKDETLTKQVIAPTDGYVSQRGKWNFYLKKDKAILDIILEIVQENIDKKQDEKVKKLSYEIVSASDSILFVKKLNEK
ncbi:hypothetical protein Fleli_3084 [Bernardetia litoralis DSM 6794]|uniref:Uncharacterized protein n=1 Tax=Bernardetia litoralis (strain ATCC 23117 / DSM 6794 / NBRC 15988 / NCIMB 1366 / Fx l1 / Sio-4) TaxID=880071 RepID=I4AN89_BERLS|nr:hypothetical protein [Bernardetia litoralis]AFM05424.1 hypothetical protein Fleli_3084 [Bernardetia litoralis DSM 6794]